MNNKLQVLEFTPEISVSYLGPTLDKGPLPAIFYFALSASDSLTLDPYNQPASYLSDYDVRVFSMTLPAHGPNQNAIDAIRVWSEDFSAGKDSLTPFLENALFVLDKLLQRGLLIREKIGVMGLSRGGFLAMQLAAQSPLIKNIVAFAPMIELTFAKEFANIQDNALANALNLENTIDRLYDKKLRIYIGNRDTRVGTDKSFKLVQSLSEKAFESGLRSPPVEMVISPSIGQMGHGTPKEIFHAGAHFLGTKLGAIR